MSDKITILGVEISNYTEMEALGILEGCLKSEYTRLKSLYFVNAHTLNVATSERCFISILNRADWVFGDGTGVRWAARLKGKEMKANLNGTDLIPALFKTGARKGYSYYLLGSDSSTIEIASNTATKIFPGWRQAGYHHGYILDSSPDEIVETINNSEADLLLVGMGNPLQEQFIHENKNKLKVKLAVGVGGLFGYWGGNLIRAPYWLRRIGFEWLYLMLQQKRRVPRYLLGNPLFIYRILVDRFAK